jgi:tetratricopeptide (TPR) repeat protein
VCRECSVRAECLYAALSGEPEHGIWGGTTADERKWLEAAVKSVLAELRVESLGDEERAMLRRRFLSLFGAVFLEPWDELIALEQDLADGSSLDDFEEATAAFIAAAWTLSPAELLVPVEAQLRLVARALSRPQYHEERRILLRITARLATLASNLSFNLDDQQAARDWCEVARRAGHEAGDPVLSGLALGELAYQATYFDDPGEVLRLAEGAEGELGTGGRETHRAWIYSLQARAHAAMGNARESLRALEAADQAMSRAPAEDRVSAPGFDHFDETWLMGARGRCHLLLGQPKEAESALQTALSTLHPKLEGGRILMLCDLAAAYRAQGERDEARKVVDKAYSLPAAGRSFSLRRRAQEIE